MNDTHTLGFKGEFETHLTVAVDTSDLATRAEAFADANGMKFARIELARGATPSQPMLSWRADGRLDDQMRVAMDVTRRMRELGIEVLRTKIEANPANKNVPQHGPCLRAEHYFESHLKLLLDEHADIAEIASIAQRHGGHLSRNSRRIRPDGLAERFATLRRTDDGYDGMKSASAKLENELKGFVREVISVEIEYVVYDSNRMIDAGWLPGEEK